MTTPLIPYNALFLAVSLLCALGLLAWFIFETVTAWRRRGRRNVLRAPRQECVSSRHERQWIGNLRS